MKQGKSNTTYSAKQEPISHGINPAYAASIGIEEMRTKPLAVHTAPGVQAPMVSQTCHKAGSQGKH
jgi:hypothetical protein